MDTRQVRQNPSFEPYRKRPIRFLELWRPNGWQIKIYGISAHAGETAPDLVDPAILESAKALAVRSTFASPPQGDDHGPGYMVVHQGLAANWLLVDWWSNGIWLYHQLHRAPVGCSQFSRVESDLIACIWELKVVEFERIAWIETMLQRATGPDVEAYLATHLTALV